ncbi:MAG: rhodanese-like domain-containing protein [Bacteroidales bacterium]|nr:rhodanese-like domain-containing protein [Bacteroidales bacterium]
MKSRFFTGFLAVALVALLTAGCAGKGAEKKKEGAAVPEAPAPVIDKETTLLLKDLEEKGDYVNSQYFPSLIKASIVFEELDKNNLVIDLRPADQFAAGHIKGAVNRQFTELPEYFEAGIRPFEYDKIILVCEEGQLSSYTTALLRMMGYGNVFAMRWGMGGWNRQYAEAGWMKGLSPAWEDRLETAVNETPAKGEMPVLGTGLQTGSEISDARFRKLFEQGTENIIVTADDVFADPSAYFVINLERKDKYDAGHIPGAVRYKPEATLGFPDMMATIPADKITVVYCGTGHNSAFASAFLRLFGYDARTLKYGNNSFMYNKMVSERSTLSWLPFTLEESNDFPVVKK